jgi:hypothetical protein
VDHVRRRAPALAVVAVTVAAVSLLGAPRADAAGPLVVDASIDGRDLDSTSSSNPVRMDPREEIPLELEIRNDGDREESIRFIRLEGQALGLTFLTYDLGVRTTLDPGEETTVEAVLDFFDLEDQATGYLGASVRVYDDDRQLLGDESFVMDVRGETTSTLGLFAIAVLAIAILCVTVLVLNTVRRRLPPNRFVRGLQFAVAGAAIGVTLALGVSILRIAFADVEAWVPLVVLPTVIGFAVGYIAPGPLSQSIRDVREEDALQYVAEGAVARASGAHAAARTSGAHTPEDV